MGFSSRSLRLKLSIFCAALAALLLAPSLASAACTLATGPIQGGALNYGLNSADEIIYEGTLTGAINQDYLQIPFDVGTGTRGMRIRYCYSKLNSGDVNPTLDLGVYGPKQAGAGNWTMDDLRGWSGSATKMIGIGENGFSDEATYKLNRKAYVPGRTSRGYKPGPLTPGTWAVELGAGWIPPGGVEWQLGITPSTNATAWAKDPFKPQPWQSSKAANSKPGWYQGDAHVHGEQEPGNALMKESLDLAFAPIVPNQPKQGAGLDFVNMVDHNNDVSRQMLGADRYQYPGKLVIPGSEITTYDGHINSQGASKMVDFRTNPIHRFPAPTGTSPFTLSQGDLIDVPNSNEPLNIFPEIDQLGGWGQQNHPETFRSAPAACRGCGWTFTDQQTGYGNIDAMEVANGIADLTHGSANPVPNPFTPAAIKFYEQRLAAGDHIAATGSSDDHRAAAGYGTGTDPVIGQGATAVYAEQLSAEALRDAIRAGQTYVKVFGVDTPDVLMTATTPEGYKAIAGHSVKGRELRLNYRVKGAADNPRTGDWKLAVIRNGIPVKTFDVTDNDFTASYLGDRSARYGFQLSRKYAPSPRAMITEAYSTPIWFTQGSVASTAPKLGRVKLNRKKGTATIRVGTIGAGRVVLKRGNVKKAVATTSANRRTVTLKLVPVPKVRKQLKCRGKAKIKLAVSFSSEWTETRTAKKTVVLKQKVKKAKRHKRSR